MINNNDSQREYLTDKSLIVIGSPGSGKTREIVIPAMRQWKGVILAYAIKDELLHFKKSESELGIEDTDNNINKAIDSLKQGNSVYLLATFDNIMKKQFEDIFSCLVKNNIESPLLIVIEEYRILGELSGLIALVRRSRVKNIKFIISIISQSKEHAINMLKEQYGEFGVTTIIENFDFIDMDFK